jgi:hypothetical protein
MLALSAHNLELHARPGDGACFFWSAGTALGDYGLASFNLFRLPEADGLHPIASPIWHPQVAGSAALLKQMRADRRACVDWLLRPENLYVLRSEENLWTRPSAFRARTYCGANTVRETWKPPLNCELDRAKVEDFLADAKWANDAVIKAYAAVKGVDVVSLMPDARGMFDDKVTVYSSHSDYVQWPASFIMDVLPRLEAQRAGTMGARRALPPLAASRLPVAFSWLQLTVPGCRASSCRAGGHTRHFYQVLARSLRCHRGSRASAEW